MLVNLIGREWGGDGSSKDYNLVGILHKFGIASGVEIKW